MKTRLLLAALLLATHNADGNDGFGGLGAAGLEFSRTDQVTMRSEDLFISIDRIKVTYVFENTSDEDVTGEVIFPCRPLSFAICFSAT